MIDKATVQKIKDTARIEDVVKDYVNLTGRGPRYMALCPFHNERTPSFSVNSVRNSCYCFSCHTGGGPIDFIMKKEGLTFPEALRRLADRYGIKIEERELTDEERVRQGEREAMNVANEWAMRYFEEQLFETQEGRDVGLSYVYDHRGLTQEAVKAFKIGYAPNSYNDFINAAKAKGIRIEVLKSLGLVKLNKKEGKYFGQPYPAFKNRVIFPIRNTAGKVVGFGGRALAGESAKYINSDDSDIYHKANELYGIFQARDSIGKEKECILVEGYLDVIGFWQGGVRNVVASCGTGLTEGQVKLIKRYTKNVTIIYDGDKAGIEAAKKAINLFLPEDFDVNVLILPDGHDPDSFAKIHTSEEIQEYIRTYRTDAFRFLINAEKGDLSSPQVRYSLLKNIVEAIALMPERMRRVIYIRDCSELLGVPEHDLSQEVEARRYNLESQSRDKQLKKSPAFQPQARPAEPSHTAASPSPSPTGSAAVSPDVTDAAPLPSIAEFPNADAFIKARAPLNPLLPLEWKVVQYCIRYGFCTFCMDEKTMQPLNVFQYVEDEMAGDATTFSVPEFEEIISIIRSLLPDFNEALSLYRQSLALRKEEKRQEGIREIGERYSTMNDISRAEQRLEESLDDWEFNETEEFAKAYVAKELSNHESDNIRKFTAEALKERHQLSNIYSRDTPAMREDDRLYRLLPAALSVWKNGIIDNTIKGLFSRLREIAGKGNVEEEQQIQLDLARLLHQRSEIAKDIGDRILTPPRR